MAALIPNLVVDDPPFSNFAANESVLIFVEAGQSIAAELNAAIESHHSSPAIRSIRGKVVRGQIPGRTALRGAIALALKKTLPELLAKEIPSEVARKREKREERAA